MQLLKTDKRYKKVEEDLKYQISKGFLQPGDKIFSERLLCKRYKLSRTSIRVLIEKLIRENLLERNPRSGTFIANSDTVTSLRLPLTRTVIFGFVPSIAIPSFFPGSYVEDIYKSFEAEALKSGYDIAIQIGDAFRNKISINIDNLRKQVCGIVIVGKEMERFMEDLTSLKIPFIVIDYPAKRQDVNAVYPDNINGGYMAARYLLELGRKKIAAIIPIFKGEPVVQQGFQERLLGCRQALEEKGLFDARYIHYPIVDGKLYNITEESENALKKFLKSIKYPLGIFACTDAIVSKIYSIAKDLGLTIPGDISIVGFEGMDIGERLDPPLTTIYVDRELMGKIAWERLKVLIENTGSIPSVRQVLPVKLIERKSCQKV